MCKNGTMGKKEKMENRFKLKDFKVKEFLSMMF